MSLSFPPKAERKAHEMIKLSIYFIIFLICVSKKWVS